MKKIILIIGIIIVAAIAWKYPRSTVDRNAPPAATVAGKQISFTVQKKSAHFETSTPSHGASLAGVPTNVVIDFNFDLGPGSEISIKHGKKEYAVGPTVIDPNLLAMRRALDTNAPDGLYAVDYNACWPDGSCHKGHFEFVVDRSRAAVYTDMTGKSEVTIDMQDITFKPQDIRISKGTKVTWVNKDVAVHYVNTDSHPAHTQTLALNSKALKQGDSYSTTFDVAGIYPYHCSAHAKTMTANILVE